MADFRLSAKPIKRSAGQSAVAAAAYRAADKFVDLRTGKTHDYTKKFGVAHTEILAPDQTPEWMLDRAELWNAVEKVERRKDAQLAREIQLSLPHELNDEQRLELVRDFVQEQFVSHGMIADVALHHPDKQSDERNFHAHVMLTMRELTDDGFGKKNRDWNSPEMLNQWRERWAHHQNRILERYEHSARVDHRSYEDRGIDRQPQQHMGQIANDMERRGKPSRIGDKNRSIQMANAEQAKRLAYQAVVNAQISYERSQIEIWAKERRENLNEVLRVSEVDLHIRHRKERDDLTANQQKENQALRRNIAGQLSAVNSRLSDPSKVKQMLRGLLGHTKMDRGTQAQLQKALQAISVKEKVEHRQLRRQQTQERIRLRESNNDRKLHLSSQISAALSDPSVNPEVKSDIKRSFRQASTRSSTRQSGRQQGRQQGRDSDRGPSNEGGNH